MAKYTQALRSGSDFKLTFVLSTVFFFELSIPYSKLQKTVWKKKNRVIYALCDVFVFVSVSVFCFVLFCFDFVLFCFSSCILKY